MNCSSGCLQAAPAAAPRVAAHRTPPLCEANARRVGLLILFGPEVRAFVYSGLAERLARRWRVSLIAANPCSAGFSSLDGWPVHAASKQGPSKVVRRIGGWNQRLHDAWMHRRGHARWRHGMEGHRTAAATALSNGKPRVAMGPAAWLRAANLLERCVTRLPGDGGAWRRLFEKLELDCLVAADYANPLSATALRAAVRERIATVVLTNSWKDVYAHPYVATPPGWIGVAGLAEAEHLRQANPHLDAAQVAVTGSLHLERFLKPGRIPGRSEFCRQSGLDPARPFLCYTAASPQTVAGEEQIVKMLLETGAEHAVRPQVLLRLNPREDGERFRGLSARFSNLVIQRPSWEWDPLLDWNAPLPGDLETWVATVYHSAFNISIPSTVTLEFAALGRSIVNVCFDEKPRPPGASSRRFWDAPFYRQIQESPLVTGAFSETEFRELLHRRLAEPEAWKHPPPQPEFSPVDRAADLIGAALTANGKGTAGRGIQFFP